MFGSVTTAAQLMVKVGADVQEAQHKLNATAKEFDALKAAGTRMSVGITAAVAGVTAATVMFAGRLLDSGGDMVAFATKAVAAGSALAESQNKVNVVFGQSAAAIDQWASTSDEAMGMSQQAALDYAGALGNMFSQLGAGQAQAAKMSQGLVGLSADLASFHNVAGGASEVLDAMKASFLGESDAMTTYIPTLSAAAVQHQALAMTGKATVDQLTALDKALATQAIMFRDAGAAVGDFARTSSDWANLSRSWQATLANLTAEIGTRLLPVLTPFFQQLVDFVQNVGPSVVATIGTIVTSFQSMITVIGQVDLSAVTAQFEGLKQSIGVDFWAEVFGFIGKQIALTVTNFQELGFELSSIGEQFAAFGEWLKGDTSWSEYRERMQELQVEYDNVHEAFQTTYDDINGRDWGGAIDGLNAVVEANQRGAEYWQWHQQEIEGFNATVVSSAEAATSLADIWTQAYEAIQGVTVTGMDNSRIKVLETFNNMAQDYAQHAQTIVDLEQRKGEMVAYLESVYQQQAAAYTAAGQTAQLGVLTQAHNAKLKAVLASYNSQIKLEGAGQTALLSNAKKYYLTTLSMMAKALIAQVAVVKANMMALVRMIVSGYGSAAAAAYAFNKIKDGMADIGSIQAAMGEVMSAFNAIEGTGIAAITEASDAFKDWKADIGDVADGLGDVGDSLGSVGEGAKEKLIDPLKAAASVVEGIGQMIQRAIDAFNTLAKWGGPQAGWVEKFNLLADALVKMVQRWAVAVTQVMSLLKEDKRNAIMQFADMVRAVMAALQAAITTMGALEEYEGVFEVSADAVTNILNFVKDMANKFALIAKTFKSEVLQQVKEFAATADSIMKLINDSVIALLQLDNYDIDIGTFARDVIDQIVFWVDYMVKSFAEISDNFSDQVLNDVKKFADGAGAVMKLIGDAVGSLMKLKDYDADFDIWAAGVEKLIGNVEWLALMLGRLSVQFDDRVMADVVRFTSTAGAVIKLIGDAVGSLMKLKDYDAGFNIFEAGVEQLIADIVQVVGLLSRLAQAFDDDAISAAKDFAATAAPVMKLIGDAIDAFMAFKDYDRNFSIANAGADKLIAHIGLFVRKLIKLSETFDADLLAQAKKFADVAGPVVKLIGDAIGSLMKFKDYDRGLSLANAGAKKLVDQIGAFVRKLIRLSSQFDADLLAQAKKFADVAGPVVKLIGDAIGSLMKFKDYDRGLSLANAGAKKLVDQIGAFVRKLIRLSSQFDADLLAAAKEFADVAGPVVELIGDAIDSLMKFKDYDRGLSLANAGAKKLVDQIGAFVRKLVRLSSQFDADLLAAAKEFADVAGAVVALIGDAITSFMKFKEYDKNLSLANAGAKKLVDQIGAFVRKLARLGQQIGQPALDAAKEFADVAGPVVALIGDAIGTFMKFKEYDKDFNLANAGAKKLVDQIGAFVRKLARLGQQIGQPALDAAKEFAEAAAAVVSTLSDALDLLTKIKTYVGPSANALLAFERDVEDMLLRFARWVVFVIQPIAADIDSDAMQAIQDMVNGLSAALELLNGLVDYVAPSAASLSAFMDGVQQLAEDFIDWATTNGPQLFREIPPEFLSAFQAVFEGLRAAVDVLTSLVDFVAPSVMAVMSFEEGYQRLFLDWVTWVQNNFSQTTNDLLVAIAAVFQQVMDGLATAVEVLTALVDFVAPSVMAVMSFEEGYQRLFEDWVTWATGTFEDLNTELVAAVAAVFGNVFDGIGAAVATLTALSGYVSPGLTAITAFETDYQRLFTGFVNWVETTFTDISTDLVVAMTGAASALFQGLGAAATTLTQITGYVGPTETTITRFEQDYQRIATGFANWSESTWTEELAATTTAVGNAVNALYQGLGTAATTLSLIRNYTPASQAVIDRFIADMTNVMGTMLTWVETSFGVDAQAIMTSFGNTTQALFSGLGTALNVLQGIAAYTVPDSQFVLALQRFNANLLTAITSWQIWLTNTFTPETAALVQQFHTILSGIVTDMQTALQLLMDIDQGSLPTADELIAFLDAVAQLFDGVIALFGGVTTEISGLVQAMADAFQEIFDTIEVAVSDFGSTLYAGLGQLFSTLAGQMWAWGDYAAGMFMSGLLAGMQNINSQNAVVNAMRDLAEQLEEELRAAWGLHSPSRVAMGIGEMFVEGLALGLRDLADIPAMIQNELALGGVALGADVRFSPAPRHDRLTIEFQGAYQAGMSPAEEKRITSAMVGELRRQGLALQVARV